MPKVTTMLFPYFADRELPALVLAKHYRLDFDNFRPLHTTTTEKGRKWSVLLLLFNIDVF